MSGDDTVSIHTYELFDKGKRPLLFIHRICTFQDFIKDNKEFFPSFQFIDD